jgi:hypothetical protein
LEAGCLPAIARRATAGAGTHKQAGRLLYFRLLTRLISGKLSVEEIEFPPFMVNHDEPGMEA